MSDSVRPHRRQPTWLPHPWDSPGKNTGVGCHFLLQCVKVKSLSCVRLFAIPWTVAYQAPPSMGFSRQEYWSGVPLPSLMENSVEIPLKTGNRTAIQPSNLTAGHTQQGNQNWKRHMYPSVIATLFTIARTWKQPRCSSADEWIRKLWYIYTMEYITQLLKRIYWNQF